jgi:hypothetical protein
VAAPILYVAYKYTYQTMDRGLLELFGPYGFVSQMYQGSSMLNTISLGYIFRRMFVFLIALLCFFMFIKQ